jgi:hypothetical protein
MNPLQTYRENIEAATRRLKLWTGTLADVVAELPDRYAVATAATPGSGHADPRMVAISQRIEDVIMAYNGLMRCIGTPKRERPQFSRPLRGPRS